MVQQKQQRVTPTMQMKGGARINEDAALEQEADVMGARAMQGPLMPAAEWPCAPVVPGSACIQRVRKLKGELSLDKIITFLQAAIENEDPVSKEDQVAIVTFVQTMSRAANRSLYPAYLETYPRAPYEEGGPIFKELYEEEKRKKQPKKKRRTKREAVEDIFSDEDSEQSEGELDFEDLYKKHLRLYQQALDHSDALHVEDVINPRNTNMLAFEGNTIIPSSLNSQPNTRAVRKSKRRVAEMLGKSTDNLRGKQELIFFGSHLGRERSGKLAESLEDLKRKVRNDEITAEAVKPLLMGSRRGFTIKGTESHAEQSLLLSETWDALKARLIKRIKDTAGSKGVKSAESRDDAVLVTVVLNRSSCRGCGLAMSLALIEFWQELAAALGDKALDWKAARKKYGSKVRFVARFPTVYEFVKEQRINFANLEEVLASLLSVGWEIAPLPPNIEAGLESHKKLKETLERLGGLPSKEDIEFFKQGSRKRSKESGSKSSKESGKGSTSKGRGDGRRRAVRPPASASRVAQDALHAFLNRIAPGWDQAFQNVAGNGAQQGNQGYMAHQIAPRHRAAALPVELGVTAERRRMQGHGLKLLANGGRGALCFVYSVLMGLTGQSEAEVHDMASYVAARAGAEGGWINADSDIAANVVAEIENIYGVHLDVVVVQQGRNDAMVSARAGQLGGTTVVIRQTPGHYDAYVPR
ncbi:hypothetical protein [Dyella sp. M7H15-1]|uniref:hypothetical protein n=1 Tax=Dyella sp. M7H15-1 TaxID=2501295 RepID=UPI001F0BA8AE|nr:hypothetical protein [Dyella sp. M7H15-1]